MWNYYNMMNAESQVQVLPFIRRGIHFYEKSSDTLILIDRDNNVWKMNDNVVVYVNSLGFTPRSWQQSDVSYIMHDFKAVYSLGLGSLKVKNSLQLLPDNVYMFRQINIIAVPVWRIEEPLTPPSYYVI